MDYGRDEIAKIFTASKADTDIIIRDMRKVLRIYHKKISQFTEAQMKQYLMARLEIKEAEANEYLSPRTAGGRKEFFSPLDVEGIFGVSQNTAKRFIDEGIIPKYKLNFTALKEKAARGEAGDLKPEDIVEVDDDRLVTRKAVQDYITINKLHEHGIAIGVKQTLGETLFTSGDTASILGMSERAVNKFIDNKIIKGFRYGTDRRVSRANLEKYILDNHLDEHGIAIGVKQKLHETLFTTGDIASIFKISPRAVGKWVDDHKIKGFKIPKLEDDEDSENKARRISRAALQRYIDNHKDGYDFDIALPPLTIENPQVQYKKPEILYLGNNAGFIEKLEENFRVIPCKDSFEMGSHTASVLKPYAIIIDGQNSDISREQREALLTQIKTKNPFRGRPPQIFVLTPDDFTYTDEQEKDLGIDHAFQGDQGYGALLDELSQSMGAPRTAR